MMTTTTTTMIYVCLHSCIVIFMYSCIHVFMFSCIYVFMYSCIHVFVCLCIHACMHVFMFSCIYVWRCWAYLGTFQERPKNIPKLFQKDSWNIKGGCIMKVSEFILKKPVDEIFRFIEFILTHQLVMNPLFYSCLLYTSPSPRD